MKKYTKLLFLFFLFSFFFFLTRPAKAVEIFYNLTCSNIDDGTCNVGDGVCPTCYSTSSRCCPGTAWTKYEIKCELVVEEDCNAQLDDCDYIKVTTIETANAICSTGDRCISGEVGLRYGTCTCGTGTLYKYCCTADGYSQTCLSNGTCPGGYLINETTVRSEPCTPSITYTCTTNGGSCYTGTSCDALDTSDNNYTTVSGTCASGVCCSSTVNQGQTMYFCVNGTCTATSSTYTSTSTCAANVATYYGITTTCSTDPTCGGSCGEPSCVVTQTCPTTTISYTCGSATTGSYSSSNPPSSGLCTTGRASTPSVVNGQWRWTCY